MKSRVQIVTIYSITHAIIDFTCAVYMCSIVANSGLLSNAMIFAFITYNFFAFAFQVPLGMILDKLKIHKYIGILGTCFIILCYLMNSQNFALMVSVLGIGNALFHLEGGINVYKISNKKAYLNGVFVAPGAIGIFLGTTFANDIIIHVVLALLFISIILLFYIQRKTTESVEMPKTHYSKKQIYLIVMLIGISIIVRSIGGSTIAYTWKSIFIWGLIYTIGVFLGKFLGGLIGDKVGFKKTAIMALALSIPLILLGKNCYILGCIGILAFNIPMAITLTILANTLSHRIGLAIGLNTMFLFMGFILAFIQIKIDPFILTVVSILLAILSIYILIKIYEGRGYYGKKTGKIFN